MTQGKYAYLISRPLEKKIAVYLLEDVGLERLENFTAHDLRIDEQEELLKAQRALNLVFMDAKEFEETFVRVVVNLQLKLFFNTNRMLMERWKKENEQEQLYLLKSQFGLLDDHPCFGVRDKNCGELTHGA